MQRKGTKNIAEMSYDALSSKRLLENHDYSNSLRFETKAFLCLSHALELRVFKGTNH